MSLIASCCCSSCGPNTALLVSQMAGRPGTQYNFPAPFLMSIRAPIVPSTNICLKEQCCVPVGGDVLSSSCAGCGGTGLYGCCVESCSSNHAFTTTGSEYSQLGAYLWNGGNFTDLKVYDSNVCRRYLYGGSDLGACWQGTIPGGCSTISVTNLYQRNTIGDVSWNNSRAVANLGTGSTSPNTNTWDKWYQAPQYVPQDPCSYIYDASGVTFRSLPNSTMGYKISTIATYPGVIGTCVTFSVVVIQHLGFDYKIPTYSCDMPSGNCLGACVNPCIVMYLRVKITGRVNRSIGTGFVAQYQGDAPANTSSTYGCNCVPPGAAGCSTSNGSYVNPLGGKKNAGCSIVDSSNAGDVRTDAYYRSYWNGSDTLKEWLEKPFSLYRISSAMSDVECGGTADGIIERSYTFASQYTTGNCVNPTGGTLASSCITNGAGGCITVPLEHVDFSAPITQIPPGGSCCKPTPGVCSGARTYICSAGPICTGRLAPAPGCVDCSGNETIELCKVCALSCVAYQACKTMAGDQSFTQADIDNMPCDWENIPLTITPIYNPLVPDVVLVRSLDVCGAVVSGTGTRAGGTLITITGDNLLYATGVTVDNIACTDVQWKNTNTVTALTPANATAGAKFVRVITPGGTSVPSAGDVFTYTANAAPATCSFFPAGGSTAGGTFLTLTGHNYTGATAVTIGGIACTAVTVLHSGAITCISPAASPPGYVGARPITVTTPFGSSTAFTQWFYNTP